MLDNWSSIKEDDIIIKVNKNLKKTKISLSIWSKENLGEIFKQLLTQEKNVRLKEELFEENPNAENRVVLQRAQAKLKRYIHFEEEVWKKKVGIHLFSVGDNSTKFFYNLVK